MPAIGIVWPKCALTTSQPPAAFTSSTRVQ